MMYDLIIVEDEDNVREGLCHLFPWANINFQIVGEFANGLDALKFIETSKVDAVLSDICLPVMDGIELAQKIRALDRSISVIFLTSHRDFKYAQQAVKSGVKDFLLKPVKYNDLMLSFLSIREELDEKYKPSDDVDISALSVHDDKIVLNVKKYIASNIQTATLEDAAVAVSLSSGYLSRFFKEKTGKTFSEYLTGIKMEMAAALLMKAQYRTYEISDMIGYDSPRNFTRAFKKYYGTTPREYREGSSPFRRG